MASLLGISAEELQSLQAQRDGALQRLQGLQQVRAREAGRAGMEALALAEASTREARANFDERFAEQARIPLGPLGLVS